MEHFHFWGAERGGGHVVRPSDTGGRPWPSAASRPGRRRRGDGAGRPRDEVADGMQRRDGPSLGCAERVAARAGGRAQPQRRRGAGCDRRLFPRPAAAARISSLARARDVEHVGCGGGQGVTRGGVQGGRHGTGGGGGGSSSGLCI
jgi:hypothetical protein